MASGDFEASEYDLGTTSVRLVRVSNIIQVVFSKKLESRIFYAETASRFKSSEERFKGERK